MREEGQLLIAPATANTIGKMAAAIDDTCVTTCVTTAIGSGMPIVVAPAMHEPMANHPGIIEAQERLVSWGVNFADPVVEEGKAKIADTETIIVEVERAVDLKPLEGKHIIVTSGGTREQIDPIRIITNLSSGKTGESVARGCYIKGAKVSLRAPKVSQLEPKGRPKGAKGSQRGASGEPKGAKGTQR